MENIIKTLTQIIFVGILLYLILCFIYSTFDPSNMSFKAKLMAASVFGLFSFIWIIEKQN